MQAHKTLKSGKIIIPAGCHVWPHEMHVAEILAMAGHIVEFLPTNQIKTADIRLDGVEFEIKSPESFNANTLEHTIRKALKQSSNIIFDMSRLKKITTHKVQLFLTNQIRQSKQVKNMLLVTKQDKIIDIKALI